MKANSKPKVVMYLYLHSKRIMEVFMDYYNAGRYLYHITTGAGNYYPKHKQMP